MIIKKNEDIEFERINDETVILVFEDNSFYKLNKTASQIFELINDKKNYEDLINEFSRLNGISKKEANSDINEFIIDCKKKKIVR